MSNFFKPLYKRVLLKISGELFLDIDKYGLNNKIVKNLVKQIKKLISFNIEIGIVIGGGNLFRGKNLSKLGFSNVVSDQVGMLSTMINGLLLKDIFMHEKISTVLMSAISINSLFYNYNLDKAKKLLLNKVVLIFCGGLGNPFFTTDSAACLRAIEINADIILKASNVDGIYSDDPNINPKAFLYKSLTYNDVLKKELKIMDLTAFILARDNNLPICVFNINRFGSLYRVLTGQEEGTIIKF